MAKPGCPARSGIARHRVLKPRARTLVVSAAPAGTPTALAAIAPPAGRHNPRRAAAHPAHLHAVRQTHQPTPPLA